jgi:4-amino-4-deoxy-L-arabinose transferase-like glycosyltransferase
MPPPATAVDAPFGRPDSRWSARRWAIALVVLVVLTRFPTLIHPKAIDDEQVYSVVAREMLHGGPPYLAAIERKPPLLFTVYALILGAAGQSDWPALHLVALVWTLATMGALYVIARRLFDAKAGIMAALLYALFQMWSGYRQLAFNGELLMNLPVSLALLLTFGPPVRRSRPELFVAGALIAVAFLLKQPAGIAGLPLATYVLDPRYRGARGLSMGESVWHAAVLAMGLLATLAFSGLILTHYGILREAIFWTLTNHKSPSIGPGTWYYWQVGLPKTALFLVETAPLCIGAWYALRPQGAAPGGRWERLRAERSSLTLLLLVSFLGVLVTGQFTAHYYLQLLPALSLLAAPHLADALWGGAATVWGLPSPRLIGSWLALTLVFFAVFDTIGLRHQSHESSAGLWVRSHSSPEDRLFVWGQANRKTGMYLVADRRPASRFIATFPLTGEVFGGYPASWGPEYEARRVLPGAWDTLRIDFAAHPPAYIIDAESQQRGSTHPISRYPELEAMVEHDFRLVARTSDGVIYQRQAP